MQTTIIITGFLITVFGGLYLMARARMKNIPVVADNDNILTLTDKNFSHQTKTSWSLWISGQAGVLHAE